MSRVKIEKISKNGFEPFRLSIDIENLEEAKYLMGCFQLSPKTVNTEVSSGFDHIKVKGFSMDLYQTMFKHLQNK